MFGLFKKKDLSPPVGAKEKLRRAQLLQQSGGYNETDLKKKSVNTPASVVVLMVYLMSMGVVYFLSEETPIVGRGTFLGGDAFSSFGDLSDVLAVIVAGAVVSLFCGLVPLLAFVVSRFSKDRKEEGVQLFSLWIAGFLFLFSVCVATLLL